MSEIDQSAGEIEELAARLPMRGDLTQGPILKTLVIFSIPMLIGNLIQTINGSINAIWVGRLIGESALAATTNANGITFMLFSLLFGFGMASTVMVGQHFGARRMEAARRMFGAGLGFSLALSVVFAALGWVLSPTLLRFMATPAESFDLANTYLRVIFLSLPFGALNFSLSMGLRGVGDGKTPLFASILTVTLDLVLNPLLIRGWGPIPALGIGGSAFASFLAGMGGMLLQLIVLYRDRLSPLRFARSELGLLVPRAEELGYVLGKGIPMGAQMLLVSSAQIVMIGLVNREGLETTAAYGASMQLWNYLQMPAFALGQAVSAMVAQAIGAKDHDRVGAVTRTGMACNVMMTGLLVSVLLLFSHGLLALFLGGGSPAVPVGQHIQFIVTWSYLVMGASMVMGGTMRSYGVVWMPFMLQFIALYPVRMGFYFVMYPHLGSNALWWSFPVASCFSALATWLLYTKGSWRKVIDQSPAAAAPSPC